jgi:hypothetical protein
MITEKGERANVQNELVHSMAGEADPSRSLPDQDPADQEA